MYFIEWTELDGTIKSDVADCWIVKEIWMSEKTEMGLNPTCRIVDEMVAERV